jgi:hypothetical protein
MRTFLSILAAAVIVVFLFVTVVASVTANLTRLLTDRANVVELAESTSFVRATAGAAAGEAAHALEQRHGGMLDASVVAGAVADVLEDEEAVAEAKQAYLSMVGAIFDFFDSGDPNDLRFDLEAQAIVKVLRSPATRQALARVIESLPECPEGEPGDGTPFGVASGQRCRAKGLEALGAAGILHDRLVSGLERRGFDRPGRPVPIDLVRWDDNPDKRLAQWKDLRQGYQQVKSGSTLPWVVPLFVLLVVAALRVRSLPEVATWVGIPLLIAAAMLYFGGESATEAIRSGLSDLAAQGLRSHAEAAREAKLLDTLGRTLGEPLAQGVKSDGLIAGVLGLVCLLGLLVGRDVKGAGADTSR